MELLDGMVNMYGEEAFLYIVEEAEFIEDSTILFVSPDFNISRVFDNYDKAANYAEAMGFRF